ncbi:peptide ABC transporter substrate-binding protein [Amaricoccus solimangrovi]|uniref:Peptide ABC transporter substrate-binding protein n=1 Tax=Amaricoccus solimangrovi TaxID=2589815 RepID=A0A501WDS4_9RHOB|nr:peptide ABC transporter substrate-binding protein [Amaricoccus solimangrovi]TPE46550.1 peptide ABC transporter substrate-binding protein [Amaricoccus solimangrovi]
MRLRHILTGASAAALMASAAHAERGADGQVNVLYYQAISIMTPYLSSGTKDIDGAALVLEPFARFDPDGHLVPYIAQEIPTLENGGISEDLKSITWKIKPDILWSDGTPVTAADAIFSWKYCTDPEGGCAQAPYYDDVTDVEAIDDKTVKVTFSVPKPYPYTAFVGAQSPIIQAKQFADCLGANAPSCTEANTMPIGTGPFRVTDFKANDVVTLEANPNYRDPAKPAFATLVLKGGGDAASAARAVLETGEFDYAWNAQVEPEILAQMAAAGKGEIISAFGTLLERLHVNQTDPAPALGEERSTVKHPHPFLTDPDVTKALSLAIDREILVETGYGEAGRPTCNLVPAPEYQNSPNNDWCLKQDLDQANKLLDDAGWAMGADGVRAKDGQRLSILYQTSVNSVRQAAQALIKQWWNEIGVEVELRQIDPAVFFGGDPGSPDTLQKFYADVEMYADNFEGTDAERYLGQWVCGEIPSPETAWQGGNTSRFCDPAYDAARAEMSTTTGDEDRAKMTIRLNDMIVNSAAIIPLIHRGRVSTKSKTLGGVEMNAFDSELWNVADWYRIK